MTDENLCTSRPLAVRTLRIVGAGSRTTEQTVHCPRRDSAMPADECLACKDSEGASSGPDGRLFLSYAHPAAQRAALVELMRQPLFAPGADRTLLADVMTQDVVCVLADLEVAVLAELFDEHNISGVPVVDEAGRATGVVSKSDLVAGFAPGATVADLMAPMIFALPATATLARAAALMAFEGVHRILVVSADGRVAGILSSLDVARWLAESTGHIHHR